MLFSTVFKLESDLQKMGDAFSLAAAIVDCNENVLICNKLWSNGDGFDCKNNYSEFTQQLNSEI
ncbi:MAG: hypothetical protein SCK70_04790 [bacterium]|nr:hypothetical protein [bacterium]